MATTATVKEIEQPKAAPPSAGFDINEAFAKLLAVVQLNARDTGGFITFTGENPILPSNHRRGAIMAMGMMGPAAATQRGGPSQNLSVDLRNAVCHINPSPFSRRRSPGTRSHLVATQSQLTLSAFNGHP